MCLIYVTIVLLPYDGEIIDGTICFDVIIVMYILGRYGTSWVLVESVSIEALNESVFLSFTELFIHAAVWAADVALPPLFLFRNLSAWLQSNAGSQVSSLRGPLQSTVPPASAGLQGPETVRLTPPTLETNFLKHWQEAAAHQD